MEGSGKEVLRMSGGLLPETVAALKGVKAHAPLFSNMIAAELFD